MMQDTTDCETCGQPFLAASKYIKHCSIACLPDKSAPRMCRICGTHFRPKVASQVYCSNPECQRTSVKERQRTRDRRSEAMSLRAVQQVDKTPFKPCVTCTHWVKLPPGVSDMGGQCVPGLFSRCRPWAQAHFHHRKEAP